MTSCENQEYLFMIKLQAKPGYSCEIMHSKDAQCNSKE